MREKLIAGPVEGYKATDKDMKCRGFQYEIGKEYELPVDAELKIVEAGFHFCKYPSGVWEFYSDPGTRVFKILAWDVLDLPVEPGADYKLVCRKIKIVEEIAIGGDRNTGNKNTGDWNTGNWNTGDWNTGYWNTGYWNTGNWNTGDRNTGYENTGDRNTGYGNTGYWNTGDWNTGDWNTGNRNTGNGNTGDRNTGYENTGDWNTGDRNTGYGNACDKCADSLCTVASPVRLFDKKVADPTQINWELVSQLSSALMSDEPIDPSPYLLLPNATPKAIKKLHDTHIARRRKNVELK